MSECQQVSLSFISEKRTTRGLTPLLQQLPLNHLVVVSKEYSEANDTAETALLKPREDYKTGRDDSLHNVRFAEMSVIGEQKQLSTQPVAIKPFNVERLATHEYRMATELNKSRPTTFYPIGFLREKDERGNEKICTVTKFDQGVTSCDNILWGGRERPQPADSDIALALRTAVRSLFILHGQGLWHGDFQAKNTAYDIALQPCIIDLTTVKKRSDPYQFGEDLSLYLSSLSRYGHQTPYPTEEQVDDLFLCPYFDQVGDMFPRSKQQTMREIIACLALNLSDVMNNRH